MKRPLAAIFLICALMTAGCGAPQSQQGPANAPGGGKFKVAMVTDVGGLGDQSFNDSAYEGLKRAEKELGAEIKVLESKAMTDYENNLASLAEAGYQMIFAVGFLMTDSVKKVAERFPAVKFGLIDGRLENVSNVVSCIFKEEEGSYLVGALAGLMTKSDKVGFVGGIKGWLIDKFESGYRAGVASTNPKAEVLAAYTGKFDDPAKGKEAALAQFNQGADIVYHASGACGNGVIEAAKEKGAGFYAIGVDKDQDHMAQGRVLTSMMKRVDVAVFETTRRAKEGSLKGGVVEFGLRQNAVGLSPMRFTKQDVPAEALTKVEELKKKIMGGELVIPSTPEKLKEWKPPAAGRPIAPEAEAYTLVLTDPGPNKIQVIKVVRELTALGLKEAKDLVDGAPSTVKGKVSKSEAEVGKRKLEAAGAKADFKLD